MQLLLAFLAGVLCFSLFHYFPFFSSILFALFAAFFVSKRKFPAALFILIGVLYAFFRYYPAEDATDMWNKELKMTGRCTQGGTAKNYAGNMHPFLVDAARDEETEEELGWMHDREIWMPTDFPFDYDEEYSLLV